MTDQSKDLEDTAAGGPLSALMSFVTAVTGPWTWDNAKGWLKVILFVLVVRWLWFEPFSIPSGSMEPTLHGDPQFFRGDRVAVNKFHYGVRVPFTNKRIFRLAEPQRWDIVVFNHPDDDAEHKVLIKRVVGLPGERIHIAGGKLHVNGEPVEFPDHMPADMRYTSDLDDPFSRHSLEGRPRMRYGVLTDDEYSLVPDDCYLVLGDNSANSHDGRYFGWVPNENIIGRAFCIWWPWAHRRDLTGFTDTLWGNLALWGLPAAILWYLVATSLFVASWRIRHDSLPGMPGKGERLLVNRVAFGLRIPFQGGNLRWARAPRLGELVVYYSPGNGEADASIEFGRVVARQGADVRMNDGGLTVDGVEVDSCSGAGLSCDSVVPEAHCLVLRARKDGENDAPTLECVPFGALIGRASLVWWPVARMRSLDLAE